MISLYCDGSAHELPNRPGGWAFAIVVDGVCEATGSGGHRRTTSSRMELQAAREGLQAVLAHPSWRGRPLELVSDSRVALEVAAGTLPPTKDAALCEAVRALALTTGATPRWVRGHSGVEWNEVVDGLAREAMQARVPAKARRRAERRRGR